MTRIPDQGTGEAVLADLESLRADDRKRARGRSFSAAYEAGRDIERIAERASLLYLGTNGLYPNLYPSLVHLENEVVAMAAAHLGGDSRTAGSFTSGGTESILLAVKAARDFAARSAPEMVLPVTAHAAFHKAAHYLGIKPVLVPVDPRTLAADVAAMRDAVTDDTVLVVGSAPSFAHGVVDPIEELGELALQRGLWLHVDACIGGFVLPYLRRLGAPAPAFDLSVPGVASISMDLHKYAFAPKGASVVLYRDRALRRHQLFACARWTGYSVVNATMQSSKSGAPLAAAWAVLRAVGDTGFLELARTMLEGTRRLVAGIEATPELHLLGRPDATIVAFTSTTVPLFRLADELNTRGWLVQEQLSFGSVPPSIHLQLTPENAGHVDALLADLRACIDLVGDAPSSADLALLGPALAGADPADLLAMAGIDGRGIPDRMADVNAILDKLPRELVEKLLLEFADRLFTPR